MSLYNIPGCNENSEYLNKLTTCQMLNCVERCREIELCHLEIDKYGRVNRIQKHQISVRGVLRTPGPIGTFRARTPSSQYKPGTHLESRTLGGWDSFNVAGQLRKITYEIVIPFSSTNPPPAHPPTPPHIHLPMYMPRCKLLLQVHIRPII